MLLDVGLLKPGASLQGSHVLPPGPEYEGLVIDDYFAMTVMPSTSSPSESLAVEKLEVASKAYAAEEVVGSTEKDVIGSRRFKVIGAEVDTSKRTVGLGRALVGAPLRKRIAMTVLSMRLAQLPVVSSDLAARVSGNWISIFMYRRCLACVIDELFKMGSGVTVTGRPNDVFMLTRKAAEEI